MKRKATTTEPQDLEQLRREIAALESRNRELEQELTGLDTRYIVEQSTWDRQHELEINRSLLALRQATLAKLEQEQHQAHAARGREEHQALQLAFQQIDDQAKAHMQALESLKAQRTALAEGARTRLASWPEHLHDILQQHAPINDDATALAEALIALRKELLKHPDVFGFFETAGMTASWFRIEPGKRADWAELDLTEVEQWLAAYRQKAL
jgi:DNA repair exonuclease SbcCD ATPase subunit